MEDSRQRLSSHTWACHLLDVTSNKLFNFLSFSFLLSGWVNITHLGLSGELMNRQASKVPSAVFGTESICK